MPPRTQEFIFAGNGKEYFGIWIVNTLLRVVTFGLYSPWAKVRKRRYFYANTLLDGAPFDFLGDPVAILKGWLMAGAFFGLYSIASNVSPIVSLIMMIVFAAVFPWVIVRSRIFNLRNSSHRNIRFSFRPNYRDAYRVFLWRPLLVLLSLGILAPRIIYEQKKFLVENSSYGTTPFCFHATAGQYYRMMLPAIAAIPVALLLVWAAVSVPEMQVFAAFLPLLILPVYLFVSIYLPAAITNLTWSSTSIADHRFTCSLHPLGLAWIHFSNAFAIPVSLGLLAPWAAVRLVKYRLSKLSLSGVGELDSVAAAADGNVGAAGEELGDMLGFDVGI